MYKKYFKRPLDFILALTAILLLWPVILSVALLLALANKGGRIFFLQNRPGKDARIFKIVKFKTMTDARDSDGNLLPDAERTTVVGRIIRSASLDELPQLFNVLKGDMSLIGPRPLLEQYLPLYSTEQARRHEVRPGITGWAQVNGRNDISWAEKFRLDVWYADHCTFVLDMKILLLTISKVLAREGVSKTGHATTDFFDGHN